jgi:7-carboxy-7-deazaguanine synthase
MEAVTDSKLRISEVYLSIQGEGPRVGLGTVFIRSAGCNLRCPGWPCDTPHAIDPKIFSKDSRFLTPQEVVEEVQKAAEPGTNICFTGGEPFLQNNDAFMAMSDLLSDNGYTTQEVFTNGTLAFPSWAYDCLYFIMDWKLKGSGEVRELIDSTLGTESVQTVREQNVRGMNEGDVVKFTIASRQDYEEAKFWYEQLQRVNPKIEFYYGVVWGKLEASELISWVLEDKLVPWMYTHQLHNVIWDRTKRGI